MTDKTDLRLVGRSEDGTELELSDQDGNQFALRISDHLRATVNQPRLVAVANPDQMLSTSVKEVQSRLRSGESADSIARSTEWDLEKIEKFSGPIMQERAFVIGQALETPLRRDPHSPTLMAATIAQLAPRGVDMQLVEWNTWRRDDGLWNINLTYPIANGSGEANWAFDTNNRTLVTEDDGARWISGEEKPSRPATPSHGMVYQSDVATTPAPRLVAVKPEEPIRISLLQLQAIHLKCRKRALEQKKKLNQRQSAMASLSEFAFLHGMTSCSVRKKRDQNLVLSKSTMVTHHERLLRGNCWI